MNIVRREAIGEYIQNRGPVAVKEIRERFPEVSTMTIHRDLERLEEEGIIVRTRGGAMPVSRAYNTETKLETRLKSNQKEKLIIAQKAVELLKEGSSVFLDAGTTVMALAQIMPDQDMSIITIGPNIAVELSRLTKAVVQMCGGTMNHRNQAVSGATTLAMLEEINIGMAFLGVSGYTLESGFTCGKEEEMMVKRLVMQKAAISVVLMDDSKYGKLLPYTFGQLEDADYIIGNDKFPQEFLDEITKCDVKML